MNTITRIPRWLTVGLLWFSCQITASAFYNPETGQWLSRDPIEERAGSPLYCFSGNDSVDRIDRDGRLIGWGGVGIAVRCGLPYYFAAMWKFNDDQDKLRHCWVSCMISRDCGIAVSAVGGVLKEIRDVVLSGGGSVKDSGEDLVADASGIACAGVECLISGLGWTTRWFRTSCEDCCRKKGY